MRAIEQGVGWLLTWLWRIIAPVLCPLARLASMGWAALAPPFSVLWTMACVDLLRWRRSPLTIACSFIPPVGMTIFLIALSLSVTQQPVALVVNGRGPETDKMRRIITADTDAYLLTTTDQATAQRMLAHLEVAAIITIPADFDTAAQHYAAKVELTLNNTDIDFADDIRRSVDRSMTRFHAPDSAAAQQAGGDADADDAPMPAATYGIAINEHDLRATNVDWLRYQVIPALVLLILCVGLIGTALFCAEDVERATSRYLALAPPHSWLLLAGRLLGGALAALLALVPAVLLCLWTHVIAPPEDHWQVPTGDFCWHRHLCRRAGGYTRSLHQKGADRGARLHRVVNVPVFPRRRIYYHRVPPLLAACLKRLGADALSDRRDAPGTLLSQSRRRER